MEVVGTGFVVSEGRQDPEPEVIKVARAIGPTLDELDLVVNPVGSCIGRPVGEILQDRTEPMLHAGEHRRE